MQLTQSFKRAAFSLPLVGELRRLRHDRVFRNAGWNCFQGVFPTLEAALAAVPEGRPSSYDNEACAEMYSERLDRVFEHDYPMLFWLKPLVAKARRVFDLGGHVGIAHYGYERYLGSLEALEWNVCDVPAVVDAGRRLATQRQRSGLTFTTRTEELDGADILYASGSLQYITTTRLPELIAACALPPKHVLLNMTPMTELPTFFTLNNICAAICPYLVQNEKALHQAMGALGYRTVDAWTNPEKRCDLPLTPEHSVNGYRGLYFARV